MLIRCIFLFSGPIIGIPKLNRLSVTNGVVVYAHNGCAGGMRKCALVCMCVKILQMYLKTLNFLKNYKMENMKLLTET